jgi:hypothetical protein
MSAVRRVPVRYLPLNSGTKHGEKVSMIMVEFGGSDLVLYPVWGVDGLDYYEAAISPSLHQVLPYDFGEKSRLFCKFLAAKQISYRRDALPLQWEKPRKGRPGYFVVVFHVSGEQAEALQLALEDLVRHVREKRN